MRYRRRRRTEQDGDFGLDLTSLMDITLVLLIIFVIVAPVLHGGVTINLPKADAEPLQMEGEYLTISVDYDGRVYLNDDTTAVPDLESAVVARTMGNRAIPVFVKADKKVEYESVFFVLSTLKGMNYQKVSLVSTTASPQSLTDPLSPEALLSTAAGENQAALPASSHTDN